MHVEEIRAKDKAEWLELRAALWPSHDLESLRREMDDLLTNRSHWGLFAAHEGGQVIGFLESSVKAKAPGCTTTRIGYIEGWFVLPEFRSAGVGRELVQKAETWAKEKGCVEMASDTTSNYPLSPAAHEALGYTEVERRYFYKKQLMTS